MVFVKLSATGRVACGGSFIDMYGRRPPATIQAVHSLGIDDAPPLTSWSMFPSHKKMHLGLCAKDDTGMNAEGEHVALAFFHSKSSFSHEAFFPVGVFRCDTWALQWAVRAESVKTGWRLCDVCCLSAQAIAFLVEKESGDSRNKNDDRTRKMGGKQLYVATRADVPRVAKKANLQWRSFLADARPVETGFDCEDICSVQAFSATSCLLLTSAGRLILVTLLISPSSVEVKSEELVTDGALIALEKKKSVASLMVVSGTVEKDTDGFVCYVAVFASGGQTCCVMQVTNTAATLRASRPQFVPVPTGSTIVRVEFAGPHILVVTTACSERTSFALSMTCLVRSTLPHSFCETPFSFVSFNPLQMGVHSVPLATIYSAERETHIVLRSRRHNNDNVEKKKINNGNNKNDIDDKIHFWDSDYFKNAELWWSCLEYAELQLHDGPYTEEVFKHAVWRSLPGPRYNKLPTVAKNSLVAVGEDGDDGDRSNGDDNFSNNLQQDIAMLNQRQSSEHWELFCLHYATASCFLDERTQESKENVVVSVLAIETAPFVHTRLVKQWHNATRGLRCLFDGSHDTVGGLPPFAVAWNPRHVRRALRLFSQEELCQLFAYVADALRVSAQQSNAASLFYGAAATAVTDVALHIITLSRQVGATLKRDDVAVVALLLRASREAGHLIVNHTTRGSLLLESVVKNRLANSLLGRGTRNGKTAHSTEDMHGNEEENEKGADEFFHGLTELRVERMLHAKYAPNTWARHLLLRRSEHADVVAGAVEHLKAVGSLELPHNILDHSLLSEQKPKSDAKSSCERAVNYLDEGAVNEKSARVPDWMLLGRRAHANFAFTEYESALVHTTTNKLT